MTTAMAGAVSWGFFECRGLATDERPVAYRDEDAAMMTVKARRAWVREFAPDVVPTQFDSTTRPRTERRGSGLGAAPGLVLTPFKS